ncbi:SRPBCC family protein [Streptomyces sp. NPDC058045]|uniref:SRPBCC family protein n=1 Tax=Streptomyces sp. NPDC058045 TaxID=3346311 RepID=UPI0036F03A32
MNIADEINRVIRRIATSGDSHQVILERSFDTNTKDLWDACTNPERLSRWFEPVRGDLTLGSRYLLTSSGTEGDILRCEPARHLAITWEYQGDVSHVDVDLVPGEEDRTVLRLTHRVPSNDHWETYGPAAVGIGWEESLRALSLCLAGAPGFSSGEMEAFSSTTEGHELIRRSANAWASAHHEAGAPSGEAQARAARTTAAYLGGD